MVHMPVVPVHGLAPPVPSSQRRGGHVDVYDATVIGLGAVGSFAIRSLDKKEQKERVCANK